MTSSNASTRHAGGTYTPIAPDGQAPWRISHIHDPLQTSPHPSYGLLRGSPIDPQLSNSEGPSGSLQLSTGITKTTSSYSHGSNAEASEFTSRLLPSYDVSDGTFDDAYVSFILYCNPTIPSDTDPEELRKAFRSPPKSDGKNFNTFTLFELIRKLESKEIKTWAQLAIDLGVEPPAIDKGQSAQKVQQYAVRLKRWMHAMHVDAFFEYLLHKNHVYWTQVPCPDDRPSEFGRDGVIPEEDLALRALLPETRPKRGRRKVEDRDKDSDLARSSAQRPRLHSPTLSEDFAIARASVIENPTPSTGRSEWSAAEARVSFMGRPTISFPLETPSSSQAQQWNGRDSIQTPITQYPQSAITPRTANPFLPYEGEPQSAMTPSSRSRRRHGPAVSSAWPSSSNFSAGKLRGRPPSNRSVSDGPFSTFPANPNAKAGPSINLRDHNMPATPVVDDSETRISAFAYPEPPTSNKVSATKPSRLFLQVPERIGGTVRLATPPPTLLVNGENDVNQLHRESAFEKRDKTPILDYLPNANLNDHFDHDASFRSDLSVRENNEHSANGSLPNELDFRGDPGEDRNNIAEVELMFVNNFLSADWFDEKGLPIDKCDMKEAKEIVKQIIRSLHDEASTKETFLISLATLAGGAFLQAPSNSLRITRFPRGENFSPFLISWRLKFGSIEGGFDKRVMVPWDTVTTEHQAFNDQDSQEATDWKKRYLELQSRMKGADEKAQALRSTVMNAMAISYGLSG